MKNKEKNMFGIEKLTKDVATLSKSLGNVQGSIDALSFQLSRIEEKLKAALEKPEKKPVGRPAKKTMGGPPKK